MLTIAQITDLHIASSRFPEMSARNEQRLRTVLAAIMALRPRPAAIVASGDLADTGDPEEYAALSAIFQEVDIPLYLAVGNHDRRVAFLAAFGDPRARTDPNGFVQYCVDIEDLRLVVCDTLDEGRSDGAFCDARAGWLAETLDEAPQRPALVVLHHPPLLSGIQWMDPPAGSSWISRLGNILSPRPQVQAIVCGHIHRPYHGVFAGRLMSVSSASSLQLTLDLSPIDKTAADGRQILLGEPPGFALHCWDHGQLITHNCVAGDFPDPITYDAPFITD